MQKSFKLQRFSAGNQQLAGLSNEHAGPESSMTSSRDATRTGVKRKLPQSKKLVKFDIEEHLKQHAAKVAQEKELFSKPFYC